MRFTPEELLQARFWNPVTDHDDFIQTADNGFDLHTAFRLSSYVLDPQKLFPHPEEASLIASDKTIDIKRLLLDWLEDWSGKRNNSYTDPLDWCIVEQADPFSLDKTLVLNYQIPVPLSKSCDGFWSVRWSFIRINTIKTRRVGVEPLVKPNRSEFNLLIIEQIKISSFKHRE